MEEVRLIEQRIKKIPRKRIFSMESICKDFSINTVKSVLRRLIKINEIFVITHELYFRPGKSHYLKSYVLPPRPDEIIKAVSKKTGEIISIHPIVALNQVGLSTQIPVRAMYHTSGRSRYIKINGENRIKLVHINPKKIIMPNTVTCSVVTALWYQGKKNINPRIIRKLHDTLGEKHFNEVIRHLDKMPRWMRKTFIQYQKMDANDPELEEQLSEYWQG